MKPWVFAVVGILLLLAGVWNLAGEEKAAVGYLVAAVGIKVLADECDW